MKEHFQAEREYSLRQSTSEIREIREMRKALPPHVHTEGEDY
jgi:hypothetical protein